MFHPFWLGSLLALLGPLTLLASGTLVEDPPTAEAARRLLDRKRWPAAVEAYREIVAHDETNGEAWHLLAYCLSNTGDLEASIDANLKSLEHGGPTGLVLYNLACSYEQTNELEQAEQSLADAIEAGYLDFDWIAQDTDLVKTRARGKVTLPKLHEFEVHMARNGVRMPYELILPNDYDPEREYPAVALIGPGSGPLSASWSLRNLCDGTTREEGCIVLLLVAPERGWYTHPTHHALEDLLKKVQKEHAIQGEAFHLVGFGSGSDPASTYANMSKRYFKSFSIVAGRPFTGDDDEDVLRHRSVPVTILLGAEDHAALREARAAVQLLQSRESVASLRVLPEDGGALGSVHHGKWLRLLRESWGR